jgi:ATP-dependent Clp protease ATP-binding subunit ClpA
MIYLTGFHAIEERIKSFFVDEVLFGRLEHGGHAFADYCDGEYRIEVAESTFAAVETGQ